jgi:hypothetical protein
MYFVSFRRPGPYNNFPDDSENSQAACHATYRACETIEKILAEAGWPHRHSYSWPDGSLCYYVDDRGLTPDACLAELRKVFAPTRDETGVWPETIHED